MSDADAPCASRCSVLFVEGWGGWGAAPPRWRSREWSPFLVPLVPLHTPPAGPILEESQGTCPPHIGSSVPSGILHVADMEWGRTISKDIVVAHHEAAHAVTAEHLAPYSVMGVSIDGEVPGYPGANTTGLTAIGEVVWRLVFPTNFEHAVAIAASRPGEGLVAEHVDPDHNPFNGDDMQLARLADPRALRDVRRTAEEIVRGNEDRIRRLAEALREWRVLDGSQVREVIGES